MGIGFLSNSRSALRRISSIHSGSFFFALMSRTTSSLRPRRAFAPADVLVGPAEVVAAQTFELGVCLGGHRLASCAGRVVGRASVVGARPGHERGADAVAVRERGEAGDVGAEQAAEGLALGVAERGELDGDVADRAVVLADLHRAAGVALDDGGGVAVGAERRRRAPAGRSSAAWAATAPA